MALRTCSAVYSGRSDSGEVLLLVDVGQADRAEVLGQAAVDRDVLTGDADVVLLLAPRVRRVPAGDEHADDEQRARGPAAPTGTGTSRRPDRRGRRPRRPVSGRSSAAALAAGVEASTGRGHGAAHRSRADDLGHRAGGGRRRVDHVRDDAGDVVGAAAAQGQVDQGLGARARVVVLAEHLREGVVADDAGQAVGADQVAVADPGLADRQVGLVVRVAGQHPGDHRPLRVALGLVLGDLALVDQALHERVVVGEPGDLAVRAAGSSASRRCAPGRCAGRAAPARWSSCPCRPGRARRAPAR